MRFVNLCRATAVLLLMGTYTAALAQTPQRGITAWSGSSGSAPVSPAVVATWIMHDESSSLKLLDLMVLWRGTPGWFTRGTGKQLSGTQTVGTTVMHIAYGGLDLDLSFDSPARIAQIQHKEIVLEAANVIMVGRVDSAEGAQIVGTMSVDPELPEATKGIAPILRRSPELVAFLRCDLRLSDPIVQAMMDIVCAQVTGK